MLKYYFFLCFSFISSMVFSQTNRENSYLKVDTLPMNNASISMIYYQLLLQKETHIPPRGHSNKTLIIVNNEKIIHIKELKKINPEKIMTIKTIESRDTTLSVNKVILLQLVEDEK